MLPVISADVRLGCVVLCQATGLPLWRTTGLGDTCVNGAVFLPTNTLMMAVADGGVARSTELGTWTRPAERWPGTLASSSQSEVILADLPAGSQAGATVCVYVTHWARGSNDLGTVLASCDDGVGWSVLGGWDGTAVINGLTPLNGSMAHMLVFDRRTSPGLASRGLFVSSMTGALFVGAADAGTGTMRWSGLQLPSASIATHVLATTELAPDLLFLGRRDGLWVGTLSGLQAASWAQLPGLMSPTALAFLPGSAATVITLLVGSATNKWGSDAGLFRGSVPVATPAASAPFKLHYSLQSNASTSISSEERTALGRMRVSSLLAMPATTRDPAKWRIIAGLQDGDYVSGRYRLLPSSHLLGCQTRHP